MPAPTHLLRAAGGMGRVRWSGPTDGGERGGGTRQEDKARKRECEGNSEVKERRLLK